MKLHLVSVVSLLLGGASAKVCTNQTVSVTISSRNGVFGNIVVPKTNEDAAKFTIFSTRQGFNLTEEGLTGYKTVHGTYKIATQLCKPSYWRGQDPAIQVLTHGLSFDRTYWDVAHDDFKLSYVNNAVDKHHFCTLSYDRLGLGQSQHGDPLNEIQVFLEVAALRALTLMLRGGKFPGAQQKSGKMIHVGHSFGSEQTFALTADDP